MNEFEEYLHHCLDNVHESRVKSAMQYSLMAGGKRVRPQLLFAMLEGFQLDRTFAYPVAAAIEMVHTYSLIHDDLPAMDDDTLRRGKPTCHVQFDEATAILAGDALLSQAFRMIADAGFSERVKLNMLTCFAAYSGPDGMIYGQCLDIEAETKSPTTIKELDNIYYYKTGKLLTLPLICGCIIANRLDAVPICKKLGAAIGYSFQIQDDVLDITACKADLGKNINSDADNHKTTYVTLMPIDEARSEAKKHYDYAQQLMHTMERFDPEALSVLIQALIYRKS